jgi:acyl-CoA thioester hydrolase
VGSAAQLEPVSEIRVRPNYSEVDQMGVVYHARYVVWFDVARTEHLRRTGLTYREMEEHGYRLVVGELGVRYLRPARYDDDLRVRCWVRDLASRRIIFGYAVEHVTTGEVLVTATTSMIALDATMKLARLPDEVRTMLVAVPDPVRL